jgi:hypothetical protein
MEILFKYNVHSILGWTDLSDLFIQFLFLWFWILFCIDCCSFLCCSPIELIKRRIWSKLSQSKSDQEFFERKFNCFTTMASQISRFKPHREHLGMYVKTGLFWKFCIYSPTLYRLCRSILFHRYYVLGHFQSVYHANPMFFDSVCHTPSICERKLFRWVRWKPIRTISTSSYPTCNTSVVDLVPASAKVVEGQCYGRVRYYCSTPPPATVVSPTASYLKYCTFQDNACKFPSYIHPRMKLLDVINMVVQLRLNALNAPIVLPLQWQPISTHGQIQIQHCVPPRLHKILKSRLVYVPVVRRTQHNIS